MIEDGEGLPSAGQRVLNIGGSLLIAAVFFVLMLRIDGRGESRSDSNQSELDQGNVRASDAQRSVSGGGQAPAVAGRSSISLPPLMLPADPAAPDREPLAGIPGAVERFGEVFTIRHPGYLPADVAPFMINWQPDPQVERQAQGYGELFTWFYSAEHGPVLVLAQGPGAGVWPLTAGDERAGRVRLADGTEAVWVIGHPTSVTGSVAGAPMWEGTEITLGIPASDGEGWYLRSPIVSLQEMIRIANSLRSVTPRQ